MLRLNLIVLLRALDFELWTDCKWTTQLATPLSRIYFIRYSLALAISASGLMENDRKALSAHFFGNFTPSETNRHWIVAAVPAKIGIFVRIRQSASETTCTRVHGQISFAGPRSLAVSCTHTAKCITWRKCYADWESWMLVRRTSYAMLTCTIILCNVVLLLLGTPSACPHTDNTVLWVLTGFHRCRHVQIGIVIWMVVLWNHTEHAFHACALTNHELKIFMALFSWSQHINWCLIFFSNW